MESDRKRHRCVYWHAKIELAYVSPVGISLQLSSMSSEVCTNEFDTSHLFAHARPDVFMLLLHDSENVSGTNLLIFLFFILCWFLAQPAIGQAR